MFDLTQTRGNKELYDIITPNVQKIGNKYFANVPVQLIFVDPEYQRVETRSKEKVTTLAQHWISRTSRRKQIRMCRWSWKAYS